MKNAKVWSVAGALALLLQIRPCPRPDRSLVKVYLTVQELGASSAAQMCRRRVWIELREEAQLPSSAVLQTHMAADIGKHARHY